MESYKFYLTHITGGTVEVFPVYSGLKFNYKKEGFRFSKDCKTLFTFRNDPKNSITDFDLINGIETGADRCELITFDIWKSCDGVNYASYWIGYFPVTIGTFNLDRCTYTFTPIEFSSYTCLNRNKDKKLNILQASVPFAINSQHKDLDSLILFSSCQGASCPSPVSGSALVYDSGNPFNVRIFAKETITTPDVAGVGVPPSADPNWVDTGSGVPGVESGWTRPFVGDVSVVIIDPYVYPDAPADIDGYGPYEIAHLIDDPNPANDDIAWFIAPSLGIVTEFKRFHTLYDIIDYMVNQICPSVNNIKSDFFEWNPVGDAPGYVAGINYVTGDPNPLALVALSQKSDMILPVSQYATLGEISFSDLMKNICTTFNCDWFLDSGNNLRIEHIKYFTFAVGFNTTIAPHAVYNRSNNIYSYKKDSMPQRERFKFMEAIGSDFVGKDIIYDSACLFNDGQGELSEKQYTVKDITTDINYIDDYPNAISKYGFVMVCYEDMGAYFKVLHEVGKISGQVINNGHLSWANLHYNYHRYGRVLLEGNMNGNDESFFTAIRTKSQNNVKLLICCEDGFDPERILVQTGLGQGEIESAEQENNIIKMQINL